jgi:hypothetical protein
MASKTKAPAPSSEADVEAHASTPKATPTDEQGGPQAEIRATAPDEDDVEGHNFAPNVMISRTTAQSRERDVQRNLQRHDLKQEARRPFFKKG